MFEGVVSQVLAGYLGRYVKGIQKDQLKIGIWNGKLKNLTLLFLAFSSYCYLNFIGYDFYGAEEILLENVDLILEAFDYLKLPFALRQGFYFILLHSLFFYNGR